MVLLLPKRLMLQSNDDGPFLLLLLLQIIEQVVVTLKFKQKFLNGPPDILRLMYAIGTTTAQQLGVPTSSSRSCFDVLEFPTCQSSSSVTTTIASSGNNNNDDKSDNNPPRTKESLEAWINENGGNTKNASWSSASSLFSLPSTSLFVSSS